LVRLADDVFNSTGNEIRADAILCAGRLWCGCIRSFGKSRWLKQMAMFCPQRLVQL
jgi:hypothetical protein